MKKLTGIMFVVALCMALQVPQVSATTTPTPSTTTSTSSLADTLKVLLEQVETLKAELAKLRGEVSQLIKDGLKEGMTDEDIKEVQELLASDRTIYPEGKITGYFGPLTKEALKRFQTKHGLPATGEIDAATKELLEEYLGERFGDKIPVGLLTAPGIAKKVHDDLCSNSGKINARGLFCKDYKHGNGHGEDDDDDDEDEDEDEDEDNDDGYDVEVEVEDGKTTVEFRYSTSSAAMKSYEVTVSTTSEEDVLEAIADELDVAVDDLNDVFVDDVQEELADAIEAEADDSEDEDTDEEKAEDAIDDAEAAIADVEEALDDADSDVDTEDAEDFIADAKEKLADAEEALDDEDFDKAEDLAKDAEDLADEAEDALDEAIEDAE